MVTIQKTNIWMSYIELLTEVTPLGIFVAQLPASSARALTEVASVITGANKNVKSIFALLNITLSPKSCCLDLKLFSVQNS
jgi:hypothetical protein